MANRTARAEVGRLGEDIACKYLESKGYRVIDRNYRRPWGEIDIIAEKGGTVRFVEVKTAKGFGQDISRENNYRPEELANATKLRKVARTAALYMESKGDDREYQIDVVGITLDPIKRTANCRLFEQALGEDF